jgi:hypothetical protein
MAQEDASFISGGSSAEGIHMDLISGQGRHAIGLSLELFRLLPDRPDNRVTSVRCNLLFHSSMLLVYS